VEPHIALDVNIIIVDIITQKTTVEYKGDINVSNCLEYSSKVKQN
jgi:hypothetical protein